MDPTDPMDVELRANRTMVPISSHLILSGLLFTIGVMGVLLRRNTIIIFMAVELMLNAVNLSFVALARQLGSMDGQVIVFFVMAVAAAEAAVGLAIILSVFRGKETVNADDLNLLTAALVPVLLADNPPLLLVGSERVGVRSYLLIRCCYTDDETASAGKKAFIAHRIGDAGFLLGLFLLFWSLGEKGIWALSVSEVQAHAAALSVNTVTAICLLLFVGATGKSAQIPLYVWLPDAMAGPTPVSALIHAATMVTAGVYMIARLHFLYSLAPLALHVVAVVGAGTALFAAAVATAQ